MKVSAMLVFWDEPAETLYEWARSTAQLADQIVAADGPFRLFPHSQVTSPPEALLALRDGAADGGTILTLLEGREWAGQVEKRDAVIKACDPSDWVYWTDADERIRHIDVDRTRYTLGETIADVFATHRYTPENPGARWRPDSTTDEQEDSVFTHPRIFRYLPPMSVQLAHWCYLGIKDDQQVAFWGPAFDAKPLPAHLMPADFLMFEHLQTWRSDEYREAQLAYRANVAEQVSMEGAEA